jgi:hypothetical protein
MKDYYGFELKFYVVYARHACSMWWVISESGVCGMCEGGTSWVGERWEVK